MQLNLALIAIVFEKYLETKTGLLPLWLQAFGLLFSCKGSEFIHSIQYIVRILRNLSLTTQVHTGVMLGVNGMIVVDAIYNAIYNTIYNTFCTTLCTKSGIWIIVHVASNKQLFIRTV